MFIKWAIFFYSLMPQIQWGKTLETKGIFLLIELMHSFVVYMQSNHINSNYRMAWYWCVFLDPFAYSTVEILVTHLITFQKLLWKDTKILDLEVYETWSIFQVILLLGVGNGRCTQEVFGRLSFFTNSIMPLAILVTVQTYVL